MLKRYLIFGAIVIGSLMLSAATTAILPINGGTGVAGTITGIPYANGTSAYTAATTGQVNALIGYTPANCTAGTATGNCETNQMTTLADMEYGGASGALTRLVGPTAAASQMYMLTSSTNGSSVAQAETFTAIPWSCQDGIGGGTAAISSSGTYATNQICQNKSGVAWTISGSTCSVDAGSGTTVTITDGSGNNLLNSTLTCASGFATAIVPGSTTTIANGGYIKWTPSPDGTAKTITVEIYGTY